MFNNTERITDKNSSKNFGIDLKYEMNNEIIKKEIEIEDSKKELEDTLRELIKENPGNNINNYDITELTNYTKKLISKKQDLITKIGKLKEELYNIEKEEDNIILNRKRRQKNYHQDVKQNAKDLLENNDVSSKIKLRENIENLKSLGVSQDIISSFENAQKKAENKNKIYIQDITQKHIENNKDMYSKSPNRKGYYLNIYNIDKNVVSKKLAIRNAFYQLKNNKNVNIDDILAPDTTKQNENKDKKKEDFLQNIFKQVEEENNISNLKKMKNFYENNINECLKEHAKLLANMQTSQSFSSSASDNLYLNSVSEERIQQQLDIWLNQQETNSSNIEMYKEVIKKIDSKIQKLNKK